jgi:hypothetical protein
MNIYELQISEASGEKKLAIFSEMDSWRLMYCGLYKGTIPLFICDVWQKWRKVCKYDRYSIRNSSPLRTPDYKSDTLPPTSFTSVIIYQRRFFST